VEVRALTEDDARAIAAWRYPGRYATYDVGGMVNSERGFWAVEHEGALVGYCCFGQEARVPGVHEEPGVLDVGYGMRPDMMGHGSGKKFISSILEFGERKFSPRRYRLMVLDWNARSRAAARSAGFDEERSVRSTEGTFVVMTRDADGTLGYG
jgi:ribosomal-protein-alanine N-acetyltransferase